MSWITYEEKTGLPVLAGGKKLTPISRALVLRIPGGNGGFLWNRPTAVQVEDESGSVQVLPIQDVTRQAFVTYALVALFFGFLMRLIRR